MGVESPAAPPAARRGVLIGGMRSSYIAGTVALAGLLACGGKVIWVGDTGGAGGDAATSSSHATTGTSGSGLVACLTSATSGGGPLGPNVLHGTKCTGVAPPMPCPPTSTVGSQLQPDPCYALQSVDAQCVSPEVGECCYNVTEDLVCQG